MPSVEVEVRVLSDRLRFLWVKSVRAIDPSVHCARCLVGDYWKGLPYDRSDRPAGSVFRSAFEVGDAPFVYACGVTPRWEDNLHLAAAVDPEAIAEAHTPDAAVVFRGARVVPIREIVNPPDLGSRFLTCRNFQFGWNALRDGLLPLKGGAPRG